MMYLNFFYCMFFPPNRRGFWGQICQRMDDDNHLLGTLTFHIVLFYRLLVLYVHSSFAWYILKIWILSHQCADCIGIRMKQCDMPRLVTKYPIFSPSFPKPPFSSHTNLFFRCFGHEFIELQ